MKQIAEGIQFIRGHEELMPDAHVYVLGMPSSGDLSLVDAGLMGQSQHKIQSILEAGIEPSDIKRVIMTHTHLDHLGCLRELLDWLPDAELWVHANEAEPMEQGDERIVYGMEMFKSMCEAQFGIKPGSFSFQVDRKLQGGETLEIGGMRWEVIHIPGHSPGSIGLYERSKKVLIPGDVVYSDHAIGRFDFDSSSGAQLKNSLFALAELEVDILLPGHNQIMEVVPKGYILETARLWEAYLI